MDKLSVNLNQGFTEAINFFKHKQNIPTTKWNDLQKEMHTRAFVIAGATKQNMLADFKGSLLKALEQGTTLEEFRKDFDNIVESYGWGYNGGRNWRTRVIYQTNVANAYQAAYYKKIMSPAVLKRRPFHMYVHNDSNHPRLNHKAYNGLVLRHDDPFWDTHRPKNGWGCNCTVKPLTAQQVKDKGLTISKNIKGDALDEGWDYDPAFASWGKQVSQQTFKKIKAQGSIYQSLPAAAYYSGVLDKLKPVETSITKGQKLKTVANVKTALVDEFKTTDPYIKLATGQTVFIDIDNFAKHIMQKQDRSQIVPFIKDMIEDPQEIWGEFLVNKVNGKTHFRQYLIKHIKLENNKYIIFSVESENGIMRAFTIFETSKSNYINKQRKGILMYKKAEE